jgi:hypothetical protein
MFERISRIEEYHPRTDKPHHFSDFFAIQRLVAMNRTLLADRLIFAKRTMFQSVVRVIFQPATIIAKRTFPFVSESTIDRNHFGNRIFLASIHPIVYFSFSNFFFSSPLFFAYHLPCCRIFGNSNVNSIAGR